MFKKITALLLLTALTHAYAVTPVEQSFAQVEELNKTFDSFNYKLNVEWDQKDAGFIDEAVAEFEDDIATLQNSGINNEDLLNYTRGNIKDNEIKKEINEFSKVLSNSQMSNEEVRAFVISKLNSPYSHGASWSGSRRGGHYIGAIIIILIVVCNNRHDRKPAPKPTHNCTYPTYSTYSAYNDCNLHPYVLL